MAVCTKDFETLNEAYAPLYGFAPLTQKQIDYYVKMYIPDDPSGSGDSYHQGRG